MRFSFKLDDKARNTIANQFSVVKDIASQREKLTRQLNHEAEFLNTAWKAACYQTQLAGNLPKDCQIIDMLLEDGMLTVNIDSDGVATWLVPDTPMEQRKPDSGMEKP